MEEIKSSTYSIALSFPGMITAEQLGEYIKASKQYPNLSALGYVARNAGDVEESHQRILKLVPTLLQICRDSPNTLNMTETDNGFLIVHTPKLPPVRSRVIRSLDLVDPVWVRDEKQRAVIQSVWEKMYDFFTEVDAWVPIEGEWIYKRKPEKCPYSEIHSDLRTWFSLVGDNTNSFPIFSVVNDLIKYGDDGYVILKNHLEWNRNAQYMRSYYQGALTTMVKTADQELHLQKQLESAGSLDTLVSQVREGDFNNLPIEEEQCRYIQRAYEFLRFSKTDCQWLVETDSPRDWSSQLREAVGKDADERQIFWALCDTRHILRYSWSHFVKNIFIAKGLGKDKLTLQEVFEYCSCDDFKKTCEQLGETKIVDAVDAMRVYDPSKWERSKVKLTCQFPQLVSV